MPKLKIVYVLLVTVPHIIYGQNNSEPVSLSNALVTAEKNYPLLKSKESEIRAAEKNVGLSKNTLIPSVDISYQANLATYNNITGMINTQGIFPISGPPSDKNRYQPVFGSAAALSLNWQAITFGQRDAQTSYAKAEVNQKLADKQQEIFKHQIHVASVYMDASLAKQLIQVAKENIDRTTFALAQSKVLTEKGLRPGVDTALFASELSKGRIDLLEAEQIFEKQKILLSQLLAVQDPVDASDSIFFSRFPQGNISSAEELSDHPLIKYPQSLVEYSKAKESLIRRSYLPKLNVWGTAYARGSGISHDGTVDAAEGLGFSRFNYGVGLQITYPILKFADKNLQSQQQNLITESIRQKVEENILILTKQEQINQVAYANALKIAAETSTQLSSSQYAFKAMQVRYNTGLANFSDVLQAQYNLLKAETTAKQSYWQVWKLLLERAAAKGDINILINELK